MTTSYTQVPTPFGPLWVAYQARAVSLAALGGGEEAFRVHCSRELGASVGRRPDEDLEEALTARLLTGAPVAFDLERCTPFQRAVLEAVAAIPRSQIRTYGQIAAALGRPAAARAVGQALRRNPIPVLIPCHRVVRSTGDLGFYTPDPALKGRLLTWEGALGEE